MEPSPRWESRSIADGWHESWQSGMPKLVADAPSLVLQTGGSFKAAHIGSIVK
jgi:hypothetical protein